MLKIMDVEFFDNFTKSDPDMEKMFFDVFFECAEEYIETLENRCAIENDDEWKRTAHSFKGGAANLGAEILAKSCKDAEFSSKDNFEIKKNLVEIIKSDYEDLKGFIKDNNPDYKFSV